MDESTSTCNKRFAAAGIAQTVEMRRPYRELIVTTPGLSESVGGAILYDETFRKTSMISVKIFPSELLSLRESRSRRKAGRMVRCSHRYDGSCIIWRTSPSGVIPREPCSVSQSRLLTTKVLWG
jgi:hypothetical protein